MSIDQSNPHPTARTTSGRSVAKAREVESGRAGIDAESRRRIGRNLRVLYGDVMNQPMPARFEALLADLSTRTESEVSS
ncbi:NepR family anti-sigma factor [Methylobacterium sp. BTF04]|uniref:NepR family anti-sigma factor n=1 Tax=Methylobacterium sp. BTF04 TaxID=2708300 RepID=UPI0019548302|nr:NepR family anti-sigma factor [Methylobacterium sp. BTF04]